MGSTTYTRAPGVSAGAEDVGASPPLPGAASEAVRRDRLFLLFACIGLVFLVDLYVPLGVAVPVAYVVSVLVSGMCGPAWVTWLTAGVCTVLSLYGLVFSPAPDGIGPVVLANRGLSILGLGITSHLTLRLQALGQAQAENQRARRENEALAAALAAEERAREERDHRARALQGVLEDLRTERERLAKEVEARKRLTTSLQDSNYELKQFAYVASHDLQTPLRGISGFAQLLAEDCEGRLGEEADDYIHRIVAGVERMQTLIHDLLSYSRVDSRGQPFEVVGLERVFDETLEEIGPLVEETGATVTRGSLPTIVGDRAQLRQLLQNLIVNGVKYGGDAPPRVHVEATRGDEEWSVSVRDEGIGIPPRHHERIFEIFRRLHAQEDIPGTGIGLAVCRRVVQRHGGKIWVESEPGHGSTFRFTLAMHQEEGT